MPELKVKTVEDLYPYAVIDSIIYFSTIDGDERLPSNVQVMYREICDAVAEFITGKESTYQPSGQTCMSDGKPYWVPDSHLEGQMWEYLQQSLHSQGHNLLPKVRTALEEMLEPSAGHDDWGDFGYNGLFHRHFDLDIVGIISRPTNLQYETKQWVEKEVIPALSTQELEQVRTMGRAMRKYILRDKGCW